MNPKDKKRVPGSPDEWLSHADSDLKLARLAVMDISIRLEHVCFHAQQSAEKAIKAVLLSLEIEFPLTHDIEELLEIAENNNVQLPEDVREAGILSPYAVETLYPGYWMEITSSDADEAIRTAEKTILWAKRILMPPAVASKVVDERKGLRQLIIGDVLSFVKELENDF